jgi:hypothetical protein
MVLWENPQPLLGFELWITSGLTENDNVFSKKIHLIVKSGGVNTVPLLVQFQLSV